MTDQKNPVNPADPAAPVDPKVNKDPKDPQAPSQDNNGKGQDPKNPDPKPPKKTFSRKERLLFQKGKIEEELAGLDDTPDDDDDRPLTVGEFKRRTAEKTRETAIELAQSIEDEDERNQVVELLESRITPSGDPKKDLTLARGAVNSLKNAQIADDLARRNNPPNQPNSPGNPGKQPDEVFKPTAAEEVFMRPPYNLTVDDVKRARAKQKS